MADDPDIPEKYRSERYKVLDGGAIYDLEQHQIVDHLYHGGGKYQINSREMALSFREKARLVGLRAQLRGLARAVNLDPAEIDDDLLLQSGSALEALTCHMAKTFLQSKNLRGMSEGYGSLSAPMIGDRRQRPDETDQGPTVNIITLISQYIQNQNQQKPIEGHFLEDSEGE
jgi:hypothetical protein